VSEHPAQRWMTNLRERADATPILVWNGLVTRMRRTDPGPGAVGELNPGSRRQRLRGRKPLRGG